METWEMIQDEFYHYGIKGMKWGVRRTPVQLGHDVNKKKKSSTSKEEKLSKKQAKLKAKQEQLRKKALKSPTLLYKNRDLFTKEEIDTAMRKFRMERDLRDLSRSEKAIGRDYVNNMIDNVNTGVKAYNTAAILYNSLSKNDRKLPVIKDKDKKRDKKDE